MVDRRRQWRAENQNISIKRKITKNIYIINGHRGKDYRVNLQKPHCECPDWQKRTPTDGCKHILKLKIEKNILDTLPSAKTDYFNSDLQSKTNYSSNWRSLSRRVKKRDQWTCQRCFAKGGPYGGVKLNAHHIIPKSKGGKDTLDNLITLCKDCHEDEHGHQISSTGSSSSQSDNHAYKNKNTASSDTPSINPAAGLRPNDRYGIREGDRIKKGGNNKTAEPNKSNYNPEQNIQTGTTNNNSGTATSVGSTNQTDNRTSDTTNNNEPGAVTNVDYTDGSDNTIDDTTTNSERETQSLKKETSWINRAFGRILRFFIITVIYVFVTLLGSIFLVEVLP